MIRMQRRIRSQDCPLLRGSSSRALSEFAEFLDYKYIVAIKFLPSLAFSWLAWVIKNLRAILPITNGNSNSPSPRYVLINTQLDSENRWAHDTFKI